MLRYNIFLLGLFLLIGCRRSHTPADLLSALPEKIDYNFHVKPILSDRCYKCHGPDPNTREANLRLDTPEGFYKPLGEAENRYAVVPHKSHKSELIKRIYHSDPEEIMPPSESNLSLTSLEKALLERWIEQGAEWKPHWAFIAPQKPKVPGISDSVRAVNEIDHFILARLEQEGLAPSPEASKEILIRRVTFDLTGLPPTLPEIDAFLADDTPIAYENVVDRLLESNAFGERMASEWLDVARYADTGGYQSDRLRRMWPWRDWVITSFNENLPFDDFLTWQLAGDLLPHSTKEQILATAFNRNHRQTEEGGSIEEEFRTEYVADRTQTTATAFLGLTMECARCHDHKYDPISQKEYYQLFGFFNNLDESGQTSFFTDAVPVPTLLLTSEEQDRQLADLREEIKVREEKLDSIVSAQIPLFEKWLSDRARASILPEPRKDLVAHLPLDRITNDGTPDLAHPGRSGKTVYEPIVQEGRLNNAVAFDGENGIELENAGNFERSSPFSVSYWLKAAEWNDWNVLVHHTRAALDAGSRGYETALQGNRLVVGLAHMWPQNAIRVVSRDTLSLNTWHHIACTYDGSSRADGINVFIDGRPAAVDIARDNLFKNITYERQEVNLTVGYRFRDTGFRNGLIDELRVYARELVPWEVAQLAGLSPFKTYFDTPVERRTEEDTRQLYHYYLSLHDSAYSRALETLEKLRKQENDLVSSIEEIMVMRDMQTPRPSFVLTRGAYDRKGERVYPGTPEKILPFPDSLPPNRLGLAQWLLSKDNPLTARVAVNRYWQLLFGRGLVATPEDFGNQGDLPSHPALLDWLAVTYRESGWDTKAILKRMVMSATYRQTSTALPEVIQRDPMNELLSRGPRFRLSAEMIRDHALHASGVLVEKVGGPPVKPYQPDGLWKEKSGKSYVPDTGDGLYRRSLYTFWKRTSPPPSMITFDASRRNQCIMRRQSTSTPLQALVLLNDPQFVEASRLLAERMHHEGGNTPEDRIAFAFRILTSRHPTDQEMHILKVTYEEQREIFLENPRRADSLISVGAAPVNPAINSAELAAYTMLASTIMNLDASILRR